MKKNIVIGLSTLILGLLGGYYLTPTKTVIKTEEVVKIQEVIKEIKVESKIEQVNKDTKIVEVISPDGTKTTTTYIIDKSKTTTELVNNYEKELNSYKQKLNEKIIERVDNVIISGLAYSNLTNIKPEFGVQVQKTLFLGITGGVFALQNKTVGLSLGLRL